MTIALWLLASLALFIALAYVNASGVAWAVAAAVLIGVSWTASLLPPWLNLALAVVFVVVAPVLLVPSLRRKLISDGVLAVFRRILPPMSQTEREAIEAGTVWWDGELFSGKPDWQKLLATPMTTLTAEEQRFLDHEVVELCEMVTDFETTNVYRDLPPPVWQYIKDKGFLGMSIPREYGGLGFSAYAHSQVMTRLSTHSGTIAVTVMVPNSLGPGELLAHYGTEEQKRYYLPRLAKGLELPCFALTNPTAGSDAASIPDYGIVGWGEHEGKRVLGLRVTWDKRYITLGPVATLLGLAFRASDPDHLLGDKEDLGITCALIPTTHPGVEIGRRHMPLNAVFQNGPTWGRDVFIPMDWVIGGQPMVGRGWRMLMECLAAGRGISLPSSGTGMAKLAVRATGGYARVRSQFKTPIGRFEGIEEALTRMGGNLYMMDAARALTATAVDQGEKPAVLTAHRQAAHHRAGAAGRQRRDGHRRRQGDLHGAVELPRRRVHAGAGGDHRRGRQHPDPQPDRVRPGAIRCHPYVLKEMHAAREPDRARASLAFDAALTGHLRFALTSFARTFVMGLTGSHFVGVPANIAPRTRRYYQQLTRFSSALAFVADVSMGTLGGALKRKEKLSARLGDILSLLYLSSAALKQFEVAGSPLGRRAAAALGDVGRDVQGAERLRGRAVEFPQPLRSRWCCAGSCSRSAGRTSCRPMPSATRWPSC